MYNDSRQPMNANTIVFSFVLLASGFATPRPLFAQPVVFPDVTLRTAAPLLAPQKKLSRTEALEQLFDQKGALKFDDSARKLIFESGKSLFELPYDSVRRIVLDETTHMRGGVGLLLGGIVGDVMASKKVRDYWMYVESGLSDGSMANRVMKIPGVSSVAVSDKIKRVFEGVVTVTDVRFGDPIERKTLADLNSKHTFKMDVKDRPKPELKPDQALIVAVCPAIIGPFGLRGSRSMALQVKLHANDHVILVNKTGTYGFAYLEPGDYKLVSQSADANGLQLKLEAGKGYFFFQDSFDSSGNSTQLSQHSKELVMHELSLSAYARWERKQ